MLLVSFHEQILAHSASHLRLQHPMILLIILSVYATCVLLNWGWLTAYFQNYAYRGEDGQQLDYRGDLATALAVSLCWSVVGPLGCIITLLQTGFAEHGWRVRRLKSSR